MEEALQTEVQVLPGMRYHHDENPNKRWGTNIGRLGHQKHRVRVSRVRNQTSEEMKGYRALQSDQDINDRTGDQRDQHSKIREGADSQRLRHTKKQRFPEVYPSLGKAIEGFSGTRAMTSSLDGKSFDENEMITLPCLEKGSFWERLNRQRITRSAGIS